MVDISFRQGVVMFFNNRKSVLRKNLMNCIQKNDTANLKIELDNYIALIKKRDWHNDAGIEAIIQEAIILDKIESLKCIIEKGFSCDELLTILVKAAKLGRFEIIKYLISKGAIIQEDEDFDTIFTAIDAGFPHIVDLLIKNYGISIHEWYVSEEPALTYPSDTFLIRAALSCNLDTIDILLKHDFSLVRALSAFEAVQKLEISAIDLVRERMLESKNVGQQALLIFEKEIVKVNQKIKDDRQKAIRILMDYAVGINFIMNVKEGYPGIRFLKYLDTLSGINFIRVMVNGQPITRELLADLKLPDAKNAITTIKDLYEMTDTVRSEKIRKRLRELNVSEKSTIPLSARLFLNKVSLEEVSESKLVSHSNKFG